MTDSHHAEKQASRAQIRRWRRYLAEERMEARTYRALAERRTGEERQVLLGLAEAEGRHEEYWLSLLGERALPAPHPPLRTRISSALAYMFGTIFILAMAQRTEERSSYGDDLSLIHILQDDSAYRFRIVEVNQRPRKANFASCVDACSRASSCTIKSQRPVS